MQKATAFDQLTTAIAAGAAAVFGVAAMAMLASPEGSVQRAVADGGLPAPVLDSLAPTVLARHRDDASERGGPRPSPCPPACRGHGERRWIGWTAVLLAARGTRAPGIVAVVAASARPDQVDAARADRAGGDARLRRRCASTPRSTTSRSPCSAASSRAAAPSRGLDVAARYVPAPRTPRSAATSTRSSSSTTGCSSPSATSAGHSIHAATVMVELRHALRAYALEGHRPSAILDPASNSCCASTTRSSSPPCACCSSTRSATSSPSPTRATSAR